eukprot:s135_g7.t1
MLRHTEEQVQAQMSYLQASINELANNVVDLHKQMNSLARQLFRIEHQLYRVSIERLVVKTSSTDGSSCDETPSQNTEVYVLDMLDD